jgi:hypothetical protein
MASLKAFVPELSRLLGTTPAALYERQRALVREKLLEQTEGHGPGSGVKATPLNLARLIIAATASEDLAACAERTRGIGESCPIVAAKKGDLGFIKDATFETFLAALLAGQNPYASAANVAEIEIHRTADRATIRFRKRVRGISRIDFLGAFLGTDGIGIVALVSGDRFWMIAEGMRALLGQPSDAREEA